MNCIYQTSAPHSSLVLFSSVLALTLAGQSVLAQPVAEPPAVTQADVPAPDAPIAPAAVQADAPPPTAPEATADSSVGVAVADDAGSVAPAVDAEQPELVAVPPAVAQPVEESALPNALRLGESGYVQLSSLMQGWFLFENQQDLAPGHDTASSFRLRRAEIKLKGALIKDSIEFALMIDPAKTLKFGSASAPVAPVVSPTDPTEGDVPSVTVPTAPADTSILQDFYITAVSDYADVSIGQFKIPISYEGYNSASKLMFPERSPAGKLYGDRRDMGVRAEKTLGPIHYVATLVNGQGVNRLDNNNQKELYGRLEYSPIDGLMVAGAGGAAIGERATETTTKERLEGDLRLEMANILLQFEYLHGWDGESDLARLEGQAFYGAVGYTILDRIQPVFRVSYTDKDIDADGMRQWQYDGGVNYFVSGDNLKLQASYSYVDEDDAEPLHMAIASVQLKY